jgi:hypothetical protein
MRLEYDSEGTRVEIERDCDTWWEAFALFADVLRGAGYQLPFDNDQMLDALNAAEDYGYDDFLDTIEEPKIAEGGTEDE